MRDERILVLSVKPRFADAILGGGKTTELRRVRPLLRVPTLALLYSSSPEMAVVGACRIDAIVTRSPGSLWRTHGRSSGVTRLEFDQYFAGCAEASGLLVSQPQRLHEPVPLEALRRRMRGFAPPQSFRYLTAVEAATLVGAQSLPGWTEHSQAAGVTHGRTAGRPNTRTA